MSEPVTWHGEHQHVLTDSHVRQVSLFVFLYITTLFAGSLTIAAHGYTLEESLFEFASSVGTTDLSVGVIAADAPAGCCGCKLLA